jgi:hypothetical protein
MISRPSGLFRSISVACLLMFPSTWKKGTSLSPGPVTLSTSAPYSPRIRPIVGPAMMRHNSRTLIPSRILGVFVVGGGNDIGGELSSSCVTAQSG